MVKGEISRLVESEWGGGNLEVRIGILKNVEAILVSRY
jgi:hypothetical protein